jgi:hypothetical protein
LIQNADDAHAQKVLVGTSQSLSTLHPLLSGPGLFIINDGVVYPSNLEAMSEIALSDKTKDENKIGKFGLGMKSVFHLCEGFFLFPLSLIEIFCLVISERARCFLLYSILLTVLV